MVKAQGPSFRQGLVHQTEGISSKADALTGT
jgi:hypothetical protein